MICSAWLAVGNSLSQLDTIRGDMHQALTHQRAHTAIIGHEADNMLDRGGRRRDGLNAVHLTTCRGARVAFYDEELGSDRQQHLQARQNQPRDVIDIS